MEEPKMPPLKQSILWTKDGIKELLKAASRTTTIGGTTTLEDVRQLGVIAYILDSAKASAGTTPTLTPTLVHASAANGTPVDLEVTWYNEAGEEVTEIGGATDPGALIAFVDPRQTDGFVGFVGTIAGTNNPAFTYSVVRLAMPLGPVPSEADPA
jgi:hypothetical protein